MTRYFQLSALLVAASMTLSACAGQGGPQFNKQNVGGVLGAAGGAVAGSQFGKGKGQLAAVAVGTLLGAFVGSEVGQSLDQADAQYAQRSAQYALETQPVGQTSAWRNPDSGNAGTITPTRTYQSSGQYCREYTQTVMVGGKKQQAYGTACRQQDGTWQVVNS
ncbi:MAG: glycine zipper 2TM domain-containing protein [Alphaproteobacteria bacterium]|jgi:surface antigen|nr:glycine zipper 2TM domain-containing protein [Alphaproteobacteria bacterium]